MKNALIIGILWLGGGMALFAQHEETLASGARVKGGFGGPFFVFSQADGNSGAGGGGGGAFILNDFFIGGFGQGETFGDRTVNNTRYQTGLSFGGFWVGYTYPAHKVVHLYSAGKIGWGSASLRRRGGDPFDGDNINDEVFVFAPEVGAEINMLHWLRLALSAGYRWVGGVNTQHGFAEDDFNSPTLGVTLRFGKFGY